MTAPGRGEPGPGLQPVAGTGGRTKGSADETLMRALYAEHARPLLAYVTRLTGDRQHAEDVVQETLVRAWRNAAALTPDRGSVRGWLLRVARNIVIDRHRARRLRPAEVEESAVASHAGSDESDQLLNSLQMLDALAKLKPEHRAVLTEVYYRGRTVVEAAEALGLPVGTVKSRTYYALRALRPVIEEGRSPAG
jgi:RNA polymerase sigma-70 factor (ECF subfamily)